MQTLRKTRTCPRKIRKSALSPNNINDPCGKRIEKVSGGDYSRPFTLPKRRGLENILMRLVIFILFSVPTKSAVGGSRSGGGCLINAPFGAFRYTNYCSAYRIQCAPCLDFELHADEAELVCLRFASCCRLDQTHPQFSPEPREDSMVVWHFTCSTNISPETLRISRRIEQGGDKNNHF